MTNEELMRELQKELFAQVGGWVQFRRDFVVQLINALKVDEPKIPYDKNVLQETGKTIVTCSCGKNLSIETITSNSDIEKGVIAYEVLNDICYNEALDFDIPITPRLLTRRLQAVGKDLANKDRG